MEELNNEIIENENEIIDLNEVNDEEILDTIDEEESGIGTAAMVAGGTVLAGVIGYGLYKAWPWLKKQAKNISDKREAKRDAKAVERVAKKNLIEAAKKVKAQQLIEEDAAAKETKEAPEK